MNPSDNDMIAAIAAQAQGRPAPEAADPAAAMAPPAPQEKPKASKAPTDIEKAQAKIAPSDPGAQPASVDSEIFRVGERDFTKAQILGTHQRYADLNHKWAQNKPVMDVVTAISEAAAKSGHQAAPDEIAALVDAAVKAYVKNPQMGGDVRKQSGNDTAKAAMSGDGPDNEGDEDSQYEKWENENAVKLPPGFKDTAKTSKQMAAKMDQMMAMFQQVIQGGMAGQKATQEAGAQLQQAQGLKASAATAMISNNLNSAFQKAGIAVDDAARGDFRAFAAQRGYDFPDFMDAGLTATVVADYQANKDAPEMNRYREILSKRQPYTEVGSSSGSGGAGAAPAGGDSMLAGMVQTAMTGRNMR